MRQHKMVACFVFQGQIKADMLSHLKKFFVSYSHFICDFTLRIIFIKFQLFSFFAFLRSFSYSSHFCNNSYFTGSKQTHHTICHLKVLLVFLITSLLFTF